MANTLINRIIRVIDLAKSDARDKAIEGVVEYILSAIDEECTIKQLQELIKNEFEFEIHETELKECVEQLVETEVLEQRGGKKVVISANRKLELNKADLKAKEEEAKRYEHFRGVIDEISEKEVLDELKKKMWDEFSLYLYECYLEHGRNVIYAFRPKKEEEDKHKELDVYSILKKYLVKFDSIEETALFKKYVKEFPERVTSEELGYLMALANKAEAFFSLGLSHDDYEQVYDEISFDWTVFTDTNFLYSVLDLHSHPDNAAAKAVLILGAKLGIKFKYLPETLTELEYKRGDFNRTIDRSLTRGQVSALVQSEKLDNFTQRYLEKKLQDWDNTPHPTDTINHAQNGLKQREVKIHRSKLEGLKKREEYLLNQESRYGDFLKMIDEARMDKGLRPKAKDESKIYHDVLLREAILYHRENKADTFSEVKHFGLTLDRTLLRFDKSENARRPTGFVIPTFFDPATLLKKLLKYAPLQAEDYRRAFISTISTPALDDNVQNSKIVMRSAQYFKNMGIGEPKLMLDCLRDEMFLDKYSQLEENPEELEEFVESELNKHFQELEGQRDELKKEITEQEKEIEEKGQQSEEKEKENEKLAARVNSMEERIGLYENALKELKKQNRKKPTVVPSTQLTIEQQQLADENKELKKQGEYDANAISGLSKEVKGLKTALLWGAYIILLVAGLWVIWYNPGSIIPAVVENVAFKVFTSIAIAVLLLCLTVKKHWVVWISIFGGLLAILVAIAIYCLQNPKKADPTPIEDLEPLFDTSLLNIEDASMEAGLYQVSMKEKPPLRQTTDSFQIILVNVTDPIQQVTHAIQ